MKRGLSLSFVLLLIVGCESVPVLVETPPQLTMIMQDHAAKAKVIILRGYSILTTEPPKLSAEETETLRELLSQGRVPKYPHPPVVEKINHEVRFCFYSQEYEVSLGELALAAIWSESREKEELVKLEKNGYPKGMPAPFIILPDEAHHRLMELPAVKKFVAEDELDKERAIYKKVLCGSAWNDERMKEEPIVTIFGTMPPEGYGASARERLEAFLKLYELGESVETLDEYLRTGLSYACILGDMDSAKRILALKPDLKHGWTNPHREEREEDCDCCCGDPSVGYVAESIKHGHREMALFLMRMGAPPTGIDRCIEADDLEMMREMVAAGAKRIEYDDTYSPAVLKAKSAEMVRYLLHLGCIRPEPLVCLWKLRNEVSCWESDKKALDLQQEAVKRQALLEAGVITQKDIEAFDAGGLSRSLISIPTPKNGWGWMPAAQAKKCFAALAGSDATAQDEAALTMLKHPLPRNRNDDRLGEIMSLMKILGDERFAAQLEKLSPEQRQSIGLIIASTPVLNISHLRENYARSCLLLGI